MSDKNNVTIKGVSSVPEKKTRKRKNTNLSGNRASISTELKSKIDGLVDGYKLDAGVLMESAYKALFDMTSEQRLELYKSVVQSRQTDDIKMF